MLEKTLEKTEIKKIEAKTEAPKTKARDKDKKETEGFRGVVIKEPNFARAAIEIEGTAPYVQNRFYGREEMVAKQKAGSSQAKTRRAKPPKDFNKNYLGSMHVSTDGWHGIPCSGLRNAMIEACRLTEFDMVRAKMCLKVLPDGIDRDTTEGLVKINGKPEMYLDRVKIGIAQTDIAARAMFKKWSAKLQIEWDADVFQATDVVNLLARAGWQVGIGAGRPLSKMSAGTGKGTWRVKSS